MALQSSFWLIPRQDYALKFRQFRHKTSRAQRRKGLNPTLLCHRTATRRESGASLEEFLFVDSANALLYKHLLTPPDFLAFEKYIN